LIIYEKGNLLEHSCKVRCHQVNCQGVKGGGIAKQVKELYPETMPEYIAKCKEHGNGMMGEVIFTECHDGTVIADMFGQDAHGQGRLQTDYEALEKCLQTVKEYASERNLSVGFPHLLGCGLAGGDWDIVSGLIEKHFKDSEVECFVVDLNI